MAGGSGTDLARRISDDYYGAQGVEILADGRRRYTGLARNLPTLLRSRAMEHEHADAVRVFRGHSLTFGELYAAASRVAGGLREHGIRPGDRVGIRLPNGVPWIVAYWGIQLARGVVVTIGHRYTQPEVDHIVGDSGASLVIDGDLPDGEAVDDLDAAGVDPAAIFYTSGTTGAPKGVVITHENAVQNAENQRRMNLAGLREQQMRTLIVVPLSHITGCHSQMVATVHAAGLAVVLPAFSVEDLCAAVAEEHINVGTAVPTIWWRVMHHPAFASADMGSLTALMYGGAPTPSELVQQIKAAFPLATTQNGFGATECTGLHTALPAPYALSHSHSVGVPMPTAEVRIDDPDDQGVGEIQVRGPNVSPGYWQNPKATRAAFTSDGWFCMGDLGRVDDGFLVVVDRLKDMIIRGGEKVFSGEVESVLAGAPNVFEVATIGVADEEMGERVAAVLTAKPGTSIDVDVLIEYAQERLAGHKIPEYVVVADEPLPRNAGGKITKDELKQSYAWDQLPILRRGPRGNRGVTG